VIVDLIEWLCEHGGGAGFYGLDLYSLRESMAAVVDYLETIDAESAERARLRYGCFDRAGRAARRAPQPRGSIERLLHDAGVERAALDLRTGVLATPLLQRMIGVIYRPMMSASATTSGRVRRTSSTCSFTSTRPAPSDRSRPGPRWRSRPRRIRPGCDAADAVGVLAGTLGDVGRG
jgi:erythromycin esterase-like protein